MAKLLYILEKLYHIVTALTDGRQVSELPEFAVSGLASPKKLCEIRGKNLALKQQNLGI